MPAEEPPVINFNQEEALSILPCLPVVSSYTGGWERIQLAHYRQPAYSLPEHRLPYHVVCINLGKPVVLEQVIDGCYQTIHSVPSDIGLYPANLSQSFCWNSEAEFLQLYLEPTLLTQLSEEAWGQDRVELIPQLTTLFDPLLQQIALALKTALETDAAASRLYADVMANALAVHLLSRYSTRKRAIKQYSRGLSQQQLNQVTEYIHEHLNQELSLAKLAAVIQLSPYHFAHLFKQSTGISPHQYHIQCRVECAKQLLHKGGLAIAEIAQAAGFASQGHLNYHFKRLTGITPKMFLRQ
jgi:AraC family transcriptional regulator